MLGGDLHQVVLALNDWGGGQFLLTEHLPGYERVAALALVACEAFDNFPPRPARPLATMARIPGGMWLTVQAMRLRALRQAPIGYGGMSRRGIPDDTLSGWFAPAQQDARIRRDFAKFAAGAPERTVLLDAATRLGDIDLPTVIVWATHDTMMPPEHGHRLAELIPGARLVHATESSTLVPMDQPELVAEALNNLADSVGGDH